MNACGAQTGQSHGSMGVRARRNRAAGGEAGSRSSAYARPRAIKRTGAAARGAPARTLEARRAGLWLSRLDPVRAHDPSPPLPCPAAAAASGSLDLLPAPLADMLRGEGRAVIPLLDHSTRPSVRAIICHHDLGREARLALYGRKREVELARLVSGADDDGCTSWRSTTWGSHGRVSGARAADRAVVTPVLLLRPRGECGA